MGNSNLYVQQRHRYISAVRGYMTMLKLWSDWFAWKQDHANSAKPRICALVPRPFKSPFLGWGLGMRLFPSLRVGLGLGMRLNNRQLWPYILHIIYIPVGCYPYSNFERGAQLVCTTQLLAIIIMQTCTSHKLASVSCTRMGCLRSLGPVDIS